MYSSTISTVANLGFAYFSTTYLDSSQINIIVEVYNTIIALASY